MPAFLKKSRNNVTTAELLIGNGLPVTSAHPAYYSVFLLLKYMLAHFASISYSDQEALTSKKDSHGILSNEALKFLAANDAPVSDVVASVHGRFVEKVDYEGKRYYKQQTVDKPSVQGERAH